MLRKVVAAAIAAILSCCAVNAQAPGSGAMVPNTVPSQASGSLGLSFGSNGGLSLSGAGAPVYNNCYWNDADTCSTSNIHIRERTFMGNAVLLTDNRTGSAVWNNTFFGSLPANAQGSNWMPRDAQLSVMTDRGTVAVSGAAQSSQGDGLGSSLKPAPVGVAGYVYNDTTLASKNAWGGYFEAIHNPNGVASLTFGVEIDTRNMSATNTTVNPYSVGQGDVGIWLGAGAGEGSGTGAPNPSAAAIVTVPNTQTFNSGIIFKDGSLTKDGSNNSVAIDMGQGAAIKWEVSSGVLGAQIRSNVSTASDDMSLLFSNNQVQIATASGATALLNVNASPSLSAPTIALATCGTNCGLWAPGASQLEFVVAGAKVFDYGVTNGGQWTFSATLQMGSQNISSAANISATNASGYQLVTGAASATAPTLVPNRSASTTGFGAQASGNISAILAATEVARFTSTGLLLPTVTTGTPTASLCLDASGNIIKKTTAGSCI